MFCDTNIDFKNTDSLNITKFLLLQLLVLFSVISAGLLIVLFIHLNALLMFTVSFAYLLIHFFIYLFMYYFAQVFHESAFSYHQSLWFAYIGISDSLLNIEDKPKEQRY